jgi:putative oxidoreductase
VVERLQRICDRALWLPPLLARVSVGLVFASTGWGKLHHLDRVIEFFRSLGIPHPELQAPFVGSTELVCGCLLVLGLGTRLVVFPLIGTMVVAIATAIWPELEGTIDLLGKEEFLFIVLLLWLAVSGGGSVSLDAALSRALRLRGERALA